MLKYIGNNFENLKKTIIQQYYECEISMQAFINNVNSKVWKLFFLNTNTGVSGGFKVEHWNIYGNIKKKLK